MEQKCGRRAAAKWALWGAADGGGRRGRLSGRAAAGQSMAEQALRAAAPAGDIEGLSINPYALSAEVRGLRVLEREGGATALSFASLYANVELESLFRGGAVVQEVKLVEPMVSVQRLEGQRYNWSDVIDEMLAKPDDGAKSTSRCITSASRRAASSSTTARPG
jgi:uncharacterized protein involved in outer membrane biogenesis